MGSDLTKKLDMKELLKRVIQFMLNSGDIDDPSWIEDAIFWSCCYMKNPNSKWNRDFKNNFFGPSIYNSTFDDFENVTVISLDDDHLKVYVFDDGYEGYEIVLVEKDGKFEIKSTKMIGEEECDSEGLSDYQLDKIINR
jgi:hypothetical protein